MSLSICSQAAQPNRTSNLLNSSPALLWLLGDDKLWCWCWCFSTKQQWNIRRSLPVPYLNLWFCFHHCSDCKKFDLKISYIELFQVVCFQWFVLVLQKQSFLRKIVRNADACVCFFNHNEMKVPCALPKISWLLL